VDRRQTTQRTLVLSAVTDQLEHPTAQQVYDKIHEDFPGIGKATVYRNLNLLADEGKLLKIEGIEGPVHFDSTLKTHSHLECKVCNKVIDVDFTIDGEVFENIEKNTGFGDLNRNIVISGICPDCLKTVLDGKE